MSELIRKTATQLSALMSDGTVSAREVAEAHLDRIEGVDAKVHAFLHVDREYTLGRADAVDAKRASGEPMGPLAGVPLALKDILAMKGQPTTCGSKMLEGWRPPYNATVVERLNAADVVILGKTNMDEFAMGSSTEHSAYGTTHNPWDLDRIPGGSGGGSAASLAAFMAPLAIGTDTGGSIRQPAAVTGTVGVKPTYGAVSRYGLIALASSLDQVGPCARTVEDAALLHMAIAGHDPKDSTSLLDPTADMVAASKRRDLTGVRVGLVKEISGDGFQTGVLQRFNEALALLTSLGADVVEVSAPSFDYALAAYYLILPSECSSNLAKFDGMRFGLRVGDNGDRSVEQVMGLTRAAGFGPEVTRRIMIGTYALSSGYYDAYYGSAQKVRTLIQNDFNAAFATCDVLVSPTAPTTAFKIGEKLDDPLAMYLNDIATIPVNLAGNCGMSLPIGLAPEDGLPVGLQIMAPIKGDAKLYEVGGALEAALLNKWGHHILEEAPAL